MNHGSDMVDYLRSFLSSMMLQLDHLRFINDCLPETCSSMHSRCRRLLWEITAPLKDEGFRKSLRKCRQHFGKLGDIVHTSLERNESMGHEE